MKETNPAAKRSALLNKPVCHAPRVFRKDSGLAPLSVACLLLFCLCVSLLASPDYFPLEKGNYWIYRGETKFLVPKKNATEEEKQKGIANEGKSEVLTWRMEVVDTATRDGLFAALIKGAPFDLSWYEPGKVRGDYLIVRVGTATYYLLSGQAALDAWARVKDETQSLAELDKSGELFLDAPLMEGKVFGGDFVNLAQGRYCWQVESERAFNPKRFPAAGKLEGARDFTLVYRTNPDHQILDFVPGLGIVGFQYVHHGTLSETDLGLIEFGRAKTGRNE